MATTKCHFSYPAISTGKKQQWFHLSIITFYQVQMINSNVFHVVRLGVHLFPLCLCWTLKRVHFSFLSASVFMPAKKTSVNFFNFTVENDFDLHTFKNSVCTNSYEKNRNCQYWGKKHLKKKSLKNINMPDWIIMLFCNRLMCFFSCNCCLLVGLSVEPLDLILSKGLQTQIHA